MNRIKFSVIVPVYNVEKYIIQCLESILNQNIENNEYEVIIVNDGSTDNSGCICREYKEKYDNIILIEQENSGLSVARNSGLSVAKGKYVVFVDSDDILQENMFSKVYDKLELLSLDVLAVGADYVNDNGESINKRCKSFLNTDQILSGRAYIKTYGMEAPVMAWQYIYLRNFLEENELRFSNGLYHEDCIWMVQWLPYAEKISSFDSIFYHYRLSEASIMRSNNLKKSQDLCIVAEKIYNCAKKYQIQFDENISNSVFEYAAYEIYAAIKSCIQQGFTLSQLIKTKEERNKMLNILKKNRRYFLIWILIKFKLDFLLELIMKAAIEVLYKRRVNG